jgi:hypothetical protein
LPSNPNFPCHCLPLHGKFGLDGKFRIFFITDISCNALPVITIYFDKSIKGNLYIKLPEHHDNNMQLKKKKKIVKIKMKNKNTLASALIQRCNFNIFPSKYAL